MIRFKGGFSVRVFTCLIIFTLCGRIHGALNEPVKVKEGRDAILPCSLSTKENIKSQRFDWKKDGQKDVFLYDAGLHYNNKPLDKQDRQFRGRVFHFRDELQHGNASIIIRNTKVADSGNYTCVFTRFQARQIFHIELVVVAATPKPYVTILDQTNDGTLLQCEVLGASLKPEVEWKDSSGDNVPAKEPKITRRGDKYDVILNTIVTKTGCYHCVATQKEINHQIDSQIFVPICETPEKISQGDLIGQIVAAVLVTLLLVSVVEGVLLYKGIIRVSPIKSCWRCWKSSPGKPQGAGNQSSTEVLLPGPDVPAQPSPV